jgi:hypothetical protein
MPTGLCHHTSVPNACLTTPGRALMAITASGVAGAQADNAEIELFQKIPDIDFLQAHAMANDDFVIVTLRGVGEMVGDKQSVAVRGVTLSSELDFGAPRAFVQIGTTQTENALWDAMDQAILQLAQVLAGGGQVEYEVPPNSQQFQPNPPASLQRDNLGSTHHESGTLWMGTNPATSVTDGFGASRRLPRRTVLLPTWSILVVNSSQTGELARLGLRGGAMIRPAAVVVPVLSSSRPQDRVCHVRAACPVAGAGSADRGGDSGEVSG